MNKKTLLLGTVVIIGVIISYYYFFVHLSTTDSSVSKNQTNASSSTVTTETAPKKTPTVVAYEPFEFKDFFANEITLDNVGKFSAPGATISFELLDDIAHQAVNSTYNVFLNQNLIGQLGGESEVVVGFSPNNKYFALRSRFNSGCAGMCQDFLIYVVDVDSSKVILIKPPVSQSDTGGYINTSSFISSVKWSDSNVLKITYFGVGSDKSGTMYRITPTQIWNYDLSVGKYSLVETLP